MFDCFFFKTQYTEKVISLSKNGFPIITYFMTDDTLLYSVLHAFIKTAIDENGEKCFRLYSTSPSAAKDHVGNSARNFEILLENESLEALAHIGGGNSDHESSAMKEINETFKLIMNHLVDKNFQSVIFQNNRVFGVVRRPIRNEDWFHTDNLAVMKASNGAFGQLNRNGDNTQHEQVHHRQALQRLYDIRKRDRDSAQLHMDYITKESQLPRIIVRGVRERQQRWLVNQESAAWMLRYMNVKTKDSTLVIIEWAIRMDRYGLPVVSDAARHLVQLLLMPEIILALHFECDLGTYFERTMLWHGNVGQMNKRPGFRMLEFHSFLLEFVMPWWECAKNNPQLGLPNTYSYWNVHFNEAKHPLASMKWQQILEGISCGYDEIICMTEILFSPPLCFLLLTDELERVPFLRALLKCIMHNNVKIDTTYPQDGFNAAKNLYWKIGSQSVPMRKNGMTS